MAADALRRGGVELGPELSDLLAFFRCLCLQSLGLVLRLRQPGLLLSGGVSLGFQRRQLLLPAAELAAAAPLGLIASPKPPEGGHGGVIVVQIVGILHQIAELGPDGAGGGHGAVLGGEEDAAREGFPVQLKQLLPQGLGKVTAGLASRQVKELEAVSGGGGAEVPHHPPAAALVLKFQAAAVAASLPGGIAAAGVVHVVPGSAPGKAVEHGLQEGRQSGLAEAVGGLHQIEALLEAVGLVPKLSKVVDVAVQQLHSKTSSPARAARPARMTAALSASDSSPANTRRMKAPFRETSLA